MTVETYGPADLYAWPSPVAPPAPGAPAAGGDDLLGQLQQLAQLQAAGVLTPEEFSAAKAKLLA
ncbi:MAG TPA: SHOCT domain-containing protein [Microlunatus sp.]|nr:SHOCT domain-containing protein [Microlunatus sp.]